MPRCEKCGHFMGDKHYCSVSKAIKGERDDRVDREEMPDELKRDKLLERFKSLDDDAETADKSTRARRTLKLEDAGPMEREEWYHNPDRLDIEGIDTPPRHRNPRGMSAKRM